MTAPETLQQLIAASLRTTHPGLYATLEALIVAGQTPAQISARVDGTAPGTLIGHMVAVTAEELYQQHQEARHDHR